MNPVSELLCQSLWIIGLLSKEESNGERSSCCAIRNLSITSPDRDNGTDLMKNGFRETCFLQILMQQDISFCFFRTGSVDRVNTHGLILVHLMNSRFLISSIVTIHLVLL